jgi:EAL domain-containing protein (putative c-di-GMP-specific phosphodiesterase class I)
VRLSAKPHRRIYARAATAVLASCLALFAGKMNTAHWVALAFASTTFLLLQCLKRHNADTASLLSSFNGAVAQSNGALKLADSIKMLEAQMATVAQHIAETAGRHPQRHPVTKLPTREPLLAAMAAQKTRVCAPSLLGAIEILDFDRLCAFDQEGADRLLKGLADRLVRMTDPSRVIAQIDRSCFAVLFQGVAVEAAHIELETLAYALRNRLDGDGQGVQPQIRSVGIVLSSMDTNPTESLARAVAALSSVGDNNAVLADPREAARQNFWLEQQLRRAIEQHEFELYYQPFVDAKKGQICGAEALLRWHNVEAGSPSPATFIPIVERIGLAEEVGLWTLDTACRQACEWERDLHAGLKIAVNMSAHQLARPDLDTLVKRTIERHGLPPSLLEIELTETVAAIDSTQAKALLQRIRALGVTVSIDDFGAGYSSLSYLKRLVFDKLKIDREFVTEVNLHKDSQAICQSIIALGRGLAIPVLAEGVETQEEYLWLRRHGCDLFQGFLFSKPVPAGEFTELLAQPHRIFDLTDIGPVAQLERTIERLA